MEVKLTYMIQSSKIIISGESNIGPVSLIIVISGEIDIFLGLMSPGLMFLGLMFRGLMFLGLMFLGLMFLELMFLELIGISS